MFQILALFNKLIDVFMIILFIRVVISWIAPYSRNDFTDIVYKITEPVLSRCKVVLPIGKSYMDLSPIIAYFGLKVFRYLINYLIIILVR